MFSIDIFKAISTISDKFYLINTKFIICKLNKNEYEILIINLNIKAFS